MESTMNGPVSALLAFVRQIAGDYHCETRGCRCVTLAGRADGAYCFGGEAKMLLDDLRMKVGDDEV